MPDTLQVLLEGGILAAFGRRVAQGIFLVQGLSSSIISVTSFYSNILREVAVSLDGIDLYTTLKISSQLSQEVITLSLPYR